MPLFNRKHDTPADREHHDAKRALSNDPVNTGKSGLVDEDSPEAQTNLAAQDRLRAAENNLR